MPIVLERVKVTSSSDRATAFKELGLNKTVDQITESLKSLYLSDEIPWVVGYSGGKDSTAVVQLVWRAITELKKEGRTHKQVHIISTDTLVENPIISDWVEASLEKMRLEVANQGLPIEVHKLTPAIEDRFWVNLIGKGYPAPRYKFRWCTSRLKISPSNTFIKEVVKSNGEAILVLGTRKAESASRSANMDKYEKGSTRDNLSRNKDLDRVWVHTPVADWSNDDIWQYLMQVNNPWNYKNQDLLNMYQGATEDGECPLVVDTSTPSCGDSRFGCYVCTMVGEDKSMAAMINNDADKEWMLPLLNLRNEIDINDSNHERRLEKLKRDKSRRDYRRMGGNLTVHMSKDGPTLVHGPYVQFFREYLLEKLLEAQEAVRELAPSHVKNIELITFEELEAIRRIWIQEKHEIEDNLPAIYQKVTGLDYPGEKHHHSPIFNPTDMKMLKKNCEGSNNPELTFQLIRELLHTQYQSRAQVRRSSLGKKLDTALDKGAFDDPNEALMYSLEKEKEKLTGELALHKEHSKQYLEVQYKINQVTEKLDELSSKYELVIPTQEVSP